MAYKINIRTGVGWSNILTDNNIELTDINGYYTSTTLDGALDEIAVKWISEDQTITVGTSGTRDYDTLREAFDYIGTLVPTARPQGSEGKDYNLPRVRIQFQPGTYDLQPPSENQWYFSLKFPLVKVELRGAGVDTTTVVSSGAGLHFNGCPWVRCVNFTLDGGLYINDCDVFNTYASWVNPGEDSLKIIDTEGTNGINAWNSKYVTLALDKDSTTNALSFYDSKGSLYTENSETLNMSGASLRVHDGSVLSLFSTDYIFKDIGIEDNSNLVLDGTTAISLETGKIYCVDNGTFSWRNVTGTLVVGQIWAQGNDCHMYFNADLDMKPTLDVNDCYIKAEQGASIHFQDITTKTITTSGDFDSVLAQNGGKIYLGHNTEIDNSSASDYGINVNDGGVVYAYTSTITVSGGGGEKTNIPFNQFQPDGSIIWDNETDVTTPALSGYLQSVVAGDGVDVDNTDPQNPTISVSLSGSTGSSIEWSTVSVDTSASASKGYFVDTASAAVTITLPSSASVGDTVLVTDYAGTFGDYTCTIDRNGHKIMGVADDFDCDFDNLSVGFVYSGETNGWRLVYTADGNSGGGEGLIWSIVSAATNAIAGRGFMVDVSSSAVTITLPSSPTLGDEIAVNDYTGNAATNNITIGRNGKNIIGSASDFVIDIDRGSVTLTYSDATNGWVLTKSVSILP